MSRQRGRRGGNIIPRTSQLERIRRAVNYARVELEHMIGKNPPIPKNADSQ